MFGSAAYAQTAGAAPAGGPQDLLLQMAPLVFIFIAFYFLLIRPQQQRAKKHQEQVQGVKRGDTVVLNSGVIGKVTAVVDTEATVEIAPKIEVKVVKSMISEVRARTQPAPAGGAKT